MKAFVFGLSLMGLIMGTSVSLMADTKAETAEENLPVFKGEKPKAEIKVEQTQTSSYLWLRVLGSLGIVVGLIGGSVYLLKKLPNTNRFANKSKMIQVLSQHYIGAKKSLAVVRVAGETVLVGITDNNISHIKTLSLLDDEVPKKFSNTLSQKIQDDNEEFSMKGIRGAFKG